MKAIILFSMFFLHILDDFHLQGILAQLKQKKWWKENYPNKLYEKDWLIALIEHSFSWSFMVCVPLFVHIYLNEPASLGAYSIALISLNTICHSIIDHAKCNKCIISLITDQLLHFIQILLSWFVVTQI